MFNWREDKDIINLHMELEKKMEIRITNPKDYPNDSAADYLQFLLKFDMDERLKHDLIVECTFINEAYNNGNLIQKLEKVLKDIGVDYSKYANSTSLKDYYLKLIKVFLEKDDYTQVQGMVVLQDVLKNLLELGYIREDKFEEKMSEINNINKKQELNDLEKMVNLKYQLGYLVGEEALEYIKLPKTKDEIADYIEALKQVVYDAIKNKTIKRDKLGLEILINFAGVLFNFHDIDEETYDEEIKDSNDLFDVYDNLENLQNKLTVLYNKEDVDLPDINNYSEDLYGIRDYVIDVDNELSYCVNNNILEYDEASESWAIIDSIYEDLGIEKPMANEEENSEEEITEEELADEFKSVLEEILSLRVNFNYLEQAIRYCEDVANIFQDEQIYQIRDKIFNVVKSVKYLEHTEELDYSEVTLDSLMYLDNPDFDIKDIQRNVKKLLKEIKKYGVSKQPEHNMEDIRNFINEKANTLKEINDNRKFNKMLKNIDNKKIFVNEITSVREKLNNYPEYQKLEENLSKLEDYLYTHDYEVDDNINLEDLLNVARGNDNQELEGIITSIHTNEMTFEMLMDDEVEEEVVASKSLSPKKGGNLLYKFYLDCKKFGSLELDKLTRKQLSIWDKLNKKYQKRLKKAENACEEVEVDIAYAKQVADEINTNLQQAVKYNNENKITRESYVEYLKARELEDTDKVIKNVDDALQKALNYAKDLEENAPKQLEKYQECYKQVKKEMGVKVTFGAIIAALAIGSLGSAWGIKNKDNSVDNKDVTIEQDNSEVKLEDEQSKETISIEAKLAHKTILMAEKKINSKEIYTLQEVINVRNAMNALNESIKTNNKMDIIQGTNDLLNIITDKEVKQEESYIPFGEMVNIADNAKIYSNPRNLVNEVNGLKPYYDVNAGIERYQAGIYFQNGDDVVLAQNDEEAKAYLNQDYEVLGYRLANCYSYDKNGNIVSYEGCYVDDDVVTIGRK